MKIARVVVDKAAVQYDKIYDYKVPSHLFDTLLPGCRVMLPFGRGDKLRLGLVLELLEGEGDPKLKAIAAQADREPVVNDEGLQLLHYLRARTHCRYFDALSVLIPPGIGMRIEETVTLMKPLPDPLPDLDGEAAALLSLLRTRRGAVPVADLYETCGLESPGAALGALEAAGLCTVSDTVRQKGGNRTETWVTAGSGAMKKPPTPKQQQVLDLIEREGDLPLNDVLLLTGVGRSVVDRLVAGGALVLDHVAVRMPADPPVGPPDALPLLSPTQADAARQLADIYGGERPASALLYGVTGSGKTSVFLHLLRQVIDRGKTAMVLVPEISLTPQAVAMFVGHFGADTAVIHSSLSTTERIDAYRRIRSGEVKIVVGTRSAVFAPLSNLGLIVIDEEQEHTYHSESAPRYHARDVAAFRCRQQGAMLLLSSATPSVESYYAAETGRMHLVTLTERYAEARLPDVYTIDLRESPLAAGTTALTETLCTELGYNLDHGEQSILLLNRRGYNTLVRCSACGEAVKCPHCEVAMTYHAAGHKLLCHYCGHERPAGGSCALCGSELSRYTGVGTQRVEEEVARLFPEARILRMDADTTGSRYAYERAFASFAAGEYDIMIGTQMVAKGLNFPRVTLVGVLLADQSFYSDDFRSYERSFSLITQVVGRCGRGQLPGRAYIQTYTPDNRIVPLAAAQDYPGFYRDEILFRKVGLYPPFCDLYLIGFTGEDEQAVAAASERFAAALAATAAADYPGLPLRLLGPAPFAVTKIAGRYRYRLLLKCRRSRELNTLLEKLYTCFYADRANRGVTAYIDPYCDTL